MIIHVDETMHKWSKDLTLLGGWLGSNADEGCDKLQNVLARSMYPLNQKFLNVTS